MKNKTTPISRAILCALATLVLFSLPPAAFGDDPPKKGPERWKADIAKFKERDQATPAEKGALLFVGSSSIRMWDLKDSWPDTATINNGFGGSTLADSIHYFDQLFKAYEPSGIILYAGDNDVAKGLTPKEVVADFETLAAKIKTTFPSVPVVFIAIKPSQKRESLWPSMKEANDAIKSLCEKDPQLHFADIARPMLKKATPPPSEWFLDDGLHLSEMGYKRWTGIVKRLLKEAKPPAG